MGLLCRRACNGRRDGKLDLRRGCLWRGCLAWVLAAPLAAGYLSVGEPDAPEDLHIGFQMLLDVLWYLLG